MLAIIIDPLNLRVTEQTIEYEDIKDLLNCASFKIACCFNTSADAQQMDVLCINPNGSEEYGCRGFEFTPCAGKNMNIAQRALVCRVDLAQNGAFTSPLASLYEVALMVDWLPRERPVFNTFGAKSLGAHARKSGATII